MRILHFHPTQRLSPLENQVADMAAYQKAKGHSVVMVTFPKSGFELLCQKKGLPFLGFNVERTVEHSKFWHAFEKVVGEGKFDVVHIHASSDVPRFMQLKQLQKLCGLVQPKIILHIHLNMQQSRKDGWSWVANSGIKEVWCSDKKSKDTVIELTGFSVNDIHVFNYGLDLPADFYFSQKAARESLALPQEPIVLGVLSPIEKISGLEDVVRAVTEVMGKNNEIQLVHMGSVPGQNSEAQNFQEFLTEWVSFLKPEIRSRIHFKGSRPDGARLIRACDLYVYANNDQNFPFGILNAQLAGVAVLAVNSGRVLDLVIENETGFVCEVENPSAMAAVLEQALANKDKWPEISARAFEKARAEFDQKSIFEKMLQRYT